MDTRTDRIGRLGQLGRLRHWGLLGLLGLLAACGSDGDQASTEVYADRGVLQCDGGGVTLVAQQLRLEAAGVTVLSASCGHDGLPRITQCGTPSGEIGIFSIPSSQIGAASSVGFLPLSGLPQAKKTSCR